MDRRMAFVSVRLQVRQFGRTWNSPSKDVCRSHGKRNLGTRMAFEKPEDRPLIRPNIVVLGGGFGGLYTTLHLLKMEWSRLQQPSITLVDRSDRFVFLPLLYELLSGAMTASEIAPYFSELLENTNVKFVQGQVTGMDAEAANVTVRSIAGDDLCLEYDRAVVALGADAKVDVPLGAREYAMPFHRIEHAVALKEKLRELKNSNLSSIKVGIIGAGYTGVELAATIAEMLGDRGNITLLTRDKKILSSATQHGRSVAQSTLKRLNVHIEKEATVTAVEENVIKFVKADVDPTDEEQIEVDVAVTTSGSKPTSVEGLSALPQNDRGQIRTLKTLQVQGFPNVFALGDIAMCVDSASRKQSGATSQAAMQQADYAAWNLYASITKEKNLAYRYLNLGEMMSLGKNNASVSAIGSVNTSGPTASAMRRAVYLAKMPTDLHRLRTGASWLARPIVSSASGCISDLLREL